MLEVWSWPTSNGHKVHIAIEELGLPYKIMPVNIHAGEQFTPEFLAINPNNRVPAIVDTDGPGGRTVRLFESGAILIYLAEKCGRLIPTDPIDRYACLQWLMLQMSGIGPMFGQYNHFHFSAPEDLAYPKQRYANEVQRLHRVLEKRLREAAYLAGDEFSIADIATFPWLRFPEGRGIDFDAFPAVKRWFDAVSSRPGVQRGFEVMGDHPRQVSLNEAEREVLFGKTQFTPR